MLQSATVSDGGDHTNSRTRMLLVNNGTLHLGHFGVERECICGDLCKVAVVGYGSEREIRLLNVLDI